MPLYTTLVIFVHSSSLFDNLCIVHIVEVFKRYHCHTSKVEKSYNCWF